MSGTGNKKPPAARPQMLIDDDRPTEIHDPKAMLGVHTVREQLIRGRTIGEMMRNPEHNLSRALEVLFARASADLRGAEIDARAELSLRHEFEFDLRVGYQLRLKVFDAQGRCVEVSAELDQDGRDVRRGSVMARFVL